MLSFLKNILKNKKEYKELNDISFENLTGVQTSPAIPNVDEDKLVETTLSLIEDWEKKLDSEQIYALNFIHSKLPKIRNDAVFFHPFHIEASKNGYKVTLFIRNGSNKNLKVPITPLTLVNNGKVIASAKFNFDELGEIPPRTSRPWIIRYTGNSVFQQGLEKFNSWGLKVRYHEPTYIKPDTLQLVGEWKEKLTDSQLEGIVNLMKKLPPIPVGKVEFFPIEIERTNEGGILTTILIRNGYTATLQLKKMPLMLMDDQNRHIAAAMFDLEGVNIHTGASVPMNFHFTNDEVINHDFDPHKIQVIHGAKQIEV